MSGIRETLVGLREQAGISQAELAKRLTGASASRISRIESGDLGLTGEDAEQIADALGATLPLAREFAEYLRETWKLIERPSFHHISRTALRKAELALQQLVNVEADPDVKNAFLQQIKSCRQALERAVAFVLSTEHSIAFIGSPGVGKTTGICALAELRKFSEKDLNRQMALQTGGGRTTICEVHVRNGSGYTVSVDPCSEDELYQHVSEFCDYIVGLAKTGRDGQDGPGISSEVLRALRNMTGLTERKKIKQPDGTYLPDDLALDLAREYPSKEDLQVQVRLRLDITKRNRTSISLPHDSMLAGLDWLSKMFADINYGKHPEFSLPRRIEVSVPTPILGSADLEIRLIDTRGVDEPSAPRRDLQAYLDDERTLIVLCSGFKDAPDAAMQAVVQRAIQGGLRSSLAARGALLVLPQDGEELSVRDNSTGDPVSTSDEGREIRAEQVAMTLGHLGLQLPVEVLNVRSETDCASLQDALVAHLARLRKSHERQIDDLVNTVTRLIQNRANEEMRAAFQAAMRPIRFWFASNHELKPLSPDQQNLEGALLEEMRDLRYASTLRASVNRRGSWHNFDFWYGLGFGTRRETVARTADQVTLLRGLIDMALDDEEVAEVHDFLRHFLNQVVTGVATFHHEVQSLGETAFFDQLRDDHQYWDRCRNRWGGGPNYKTDIRQWTNQWFDHTTREERYRFIEQEVQRRWRDLMGSLDAQLASVQPAEDVAVLREAE